VKDSNSGSWIGAGMAAILAEGLIGKAPMISLTSSKMPTQHKSLWAACSKIMNLSLQWWFIFHPSL